MKLEQVIEAVDCINTEIYDKMTEIGSSYSVEDYSELWVESNAYVYAVKLCGIHLWDSENDERDYTDDGYNQEDLTTHLKKRMKEEVEKLQVMVLEL